jgi:hypothetical protein
VKKTSPSSSNPFNNTVRVEGRPARLTVASVIAFMLRLPLSSARASVAFSAAMASAYTSIIFHSQKIVH